jgi:hypothetical protein
MAEEALVETCHRYRTRSGSVRGHPDFVYIFEEAFCEGMGVSDRVRKKFEVCTEKKAGLRRSQAKGQM